jgi:hypothetical protein
LVKSAGIGFDEDPAPLPLARPVPGDLGMPTPRVCCGRRPPAKQGQGPAWTSEHLALLTASIGGHRRAGHRLVHRRPRCPLAGARLLSISNSFLSPNGATTDLPARAMKLTYIEFFVKRVIFLAVQIVTPIAKI